MESVHESRDWHEAIALARRLDHDVQVLVSKVDEPGLPDDIDLLSSNFPWSIHKGARRVYREDSGGEHLQLREFRDYWTVSRDRFNPHYRPVTHARNDVPASSLTTLPLFAATQSMLAAGRLSTTLVDKQGKLVSGVLLPAVRKTVTRESQSSLSNKLSRYW